ncbi:teichuronic acid biosynthesis protein TuaE [Sutcliffiella horikoshii]|uniref:teichuronic acid biosynthesis protein TuaE n=1 Tax=Sutcliffiella horikoshii TaxID=79883 RepID=UPI001CFE5CCB|nr:O-antigen ligase family protein [Sutcliffiella horikoshii]
MNPGTVKNAPFWTGAVLLFLGIIVTLAAIKLEMSSYVPFVLLNFGVIMLLLFKKYIFNMDFILVTIYVLLASTFLNNAFFSVNLGFFSLFPYRILLIIVGALIVLNLYRSNFRENLWSDWKNVKVKGSLLFFVFWLYYALFTLLWAKSVNDGIKYISILVMGIFLLFVVTLFINNVNRLTVFFYIWVSMSIFLMLIGYVNNLFEFQLPSSTLYDGPEYKAHYPTAVFFNQNDFATFLSITLFFFLSLIRNGKSLSVKIVGIVLSLGALHLIMLTDSRASQLAAVAGVGLYLFLLSSTYIKKWLLIMGSVGTALFIAIFYSKLWEKISSLFFSPTIRDFSAALPSNEGRANLMRNALYFTFDSFGLGIGAGNAEYYMENYSIFDTDEVVNIHFWFLEILTNFGIIVFLGYITLYAYLMYKLYQYYQRGLTNNYKLFVEALLVSLGAFVFSSISPSSVANLYFHWVLFAFALATLNVLRNQSASNSLPKISQPPGY